MAILVNMKRTCLRFCFLAMLIAPTLLVAKSAPLAVALTRNFQLPPHDWTIYGLSLTAFEAKRDAGLVGIGIALGGQDISEVNGIQISGFKNSSDDVDGVQIAGLANLAGSIRGVMISGLVNVGGAGGNRHSSGLQLALFGNNVELVNPGKDGPVSFLDGVQISLGQNTAHHLRGAQVSLSANEAVQCSGLQLGLSNHAKELHGVQIGLYNQAESGVGVQLGLINHFGRGEDSLCLPFMNARF